MWPQCPAASYNYLTLRKPILPQAQRTYQANVCYCASFNRGGGSTYLVWGNSRIYIISNKRAAALSESTRAHTPTAIIMCPLAFQSGYRLRG